MSSENVKIHVIGHSVLTALGWVPLELSRVDRARADLLTQQKGKVTVEYCDLTSGRTCERLL